ncbi:MAG: DNA-processing protein DprA, partial [Blautia sp.]|nr:DNA-processing protein DprA [Blautia sp.]
SGMAKGIDSYAHTACLKSGGYTVAVLGNGLDICYPCEHRKLMEQIAEKGLLISEYPPGIRPAKYRFPCRNRLISAWSDKMIVVAPGKGSGALITAEYEKKYGRKVEVIYC